MPRTLNKPPFAQPSIGVVVPAYNAETTLAQCLQALLAMTLKANEIVVIDDGSTDRTANIVGAYGMRLLTIPSPSRGPAYARNMGTAALHSDFVMFVDSDVVVHPDALSRLLDDIEEHRASAAFGSYDDRPKSRRATSLYANLRHHYVHQHGSRDATSFWSGLGLIDRRVFLENGGFDELRYRRPSIEDVELGARLISAGHRIRLVPEAQGTHHKDWRLSNVWWTDIARRAYPWTVLIAEGNGPSADLNLATAERVKAASAITTLIAGAAGFVWPKALWVAGPAAGMFLALNFPFFAYLSRRVGRSALLTAIAMHWIYHLYAAVTFAMTFVWALIKHRFGRTHRGAIRQATPRL